VSLSDAAVFFAGRNAQDARATFGSAFVALCAGMAAAVLLLGGGYPFVLKLGATTRFADVAPWIALAALAQASIFAQTMARCLDRIGLWFWLRILATWVYAIVLTAAAVTMGMDASLAGLSACAGAVVTAAVGFWAMRRALVPIAYSAARMRQLLSYGLKLHPSSLAQMARDQLDKVILVLFVPAGELGRYVVALALGSLIVSVVISLDQVIFPRLAAILDAGERRAAFLKMAGLFAPMIIVGGALLMLVAPPLVRIVFGQDFASEPALIVAGVAVGLTYGIKVIANIGLKIENKPGLLGANDAVGSLVGLAIMIVAVKFLGIYGAPLGSGLGALISLALTVRVILRQYSARAPA
ncbi:MAG: lipopolysaccharide biosynthesis protein, partial [Caulobacteraceae bacterium]